MQAIASTVELARRTGQSARIVWIVHRQKNIGAKFSDIFEPIPDLPIEEIDPDCSQRDWLKSIYYAIGRKGEVRLFNAVARRFQFDLVLGNDDTRHGLDQELVDRVGKGDAPLFITGHEFLPPSTDYSELFSLRPGLQAGVEDAAGCIDDRTIGVHIRRTDHDRAMRHSPDEEFARVIEREIDVNPEVRFYLATDSPQTKQRFRAKFGDRIVASEVKLSRTTQLGIEGAIIDLYCLSRCRKIYGSAVSTFSRVAAMLGKTPIVRVTHNTSILFRPFDPVLKP
jgi:hypothetical protein